MLNATPPAPVWGRHLSGHYVPPAIFGALAPIMGDRIVAESGSPLWNVYFGGRYDDDRGNFVKMFFMNGGHGARGHGDGPGCLSFPSNVSNQPIEAFEHQVPMLVREKSFVPDSGGAGKYRGGNAQKIVFEARSKNPMTMTIRHERISYPPRGLMGGMPGDAGIDMVNGERIAAKSRTTLVAGDIVEFKTPGGGGLFDPTERETTLIKKDLETGLTTPAASKESYNYD